VLRGSTEWGSEYGVRSTPEYSGVPEYSGALRSTPSTPSNPQRYAVSRTPYIPGCYWYREYSLLRVLRSSVEGPWALPVITDSVAPWNLARFVSLSEITARY
jgi:hypothetical protein